MGRKKEKDKKKKVRVTKPVKNSKIKAKKVKKVTKPATQKEESKVKAAAYFERSDLQQALRIAADFTEIKTNAMPILSCVLLQRVDGGCRIVGTDLETTWIKEIPCEADGDFSVAVPAQTLLKEVTALPLNIDKVELKFISKGDEDVANYVMVNDRCKIFTMSGDEYPKVKKCTNLKSVTITNLVDNIKAVIKAAGVEDTRYTLNGVYFDFENGKMVATDGHRMHMRDIPKRKGSNSFIAPRKAMLLAVRHGAKDVIEYNGKDMLLDVADGKMIARLIDGKFPDYKNITVEEKSTAHFLSKEFLKILEGAIPVSNIGKAIVIHFNKDMEVWASSSERGEYHWKLGCKIEGAHYDEVRIGFNAQYLIDAISSYPQEASSISFGEPNEKGIITPCLVNRQAILMPMRI